MSRVQGILEGNILTPSLPLTEREELAWALREATQRIKALEGSLSHLTHVDGHRELEARVTQAEEDIANLRSDSGL